MLRLFRSTRRCQKDGKPTRSERREHGYSDNSRSNSCLWRNADMPVYALESSHVKGRTNRRQCKHLSEGTPCKQPLWWDHANTCSEVLWDKHLEKYQYQFVDPTVSKYVKKSGSLLERMKVPVVENILHGSPIFLTTPSLLVSLRVSLAPREYSLRVAGGTYRCALTTADL